MESAGFKKRYVFFLVMSFFLFSSALCFSQEKEKSFSPSDAIKEYRAVLGFATDPVEIAEAHYKIGLALEELGKENEATGEYLKIITNYPQIKEANKKAEARLDRLYAGFRERARELVGSYRETPGQKDPAVFFAYVKSLYEDRRNHGEYKKALNVLKNVYDMDPENSSYLIDIGEIYLRGYDDADKAIFHFKKALEADPNNQRYHIHLGAAYEKKEDYESAIAAYTKAAEIAPASPWALYGLRRINGMRLATERRLVKDWYFLGPFDNSAKDGLEKYFPPEEKIDFRVAYTGKDGARIRWLRPFDYDASGYVDLNILFKPNDFAVAYALTYVYAPKDCKVQFRLGFEDGIRIGLNDRIIFSGDASGGFAEADGELIAVDLKQGWNKVLVKIADTWGSWGFYFRATDLNGNPVDNLIFDPLKDNARLRRIYGELAREKRFKFTKIALIYTLAVSVLLLGLYLMISNIYSKIKINRMKEDFISSVSHELKTPISAVRMLAETLRRGKVKESLRVNQYYDMIIRESDRLTRFINKILDFSKIEKGEKVLYFEKTNIANLAKTAIDFYRDEAQDKNLKLRLNAEKNEIFSGIDKDAILQVILNLMDNAYKYSGDEKDITVNVEEVGKDARIEVIDKGFGISKSNIEKIFDKFYRSDRDMLREIKGSGLGLSFVKNIINEHGGKVAVESEIGKGSKFIVSLPIVK